MRSRSERGQATVEAAFLLPVLFLVFGLFLQASILLYDRAVMTAAASESCRLVATNTGSDEVLRGYVVRRLGGIPKLDVFHAGGDGSWDITWKGPGKKGKVSMKVVNRAQPLPLFGIVAGLGGHVTDGGLVEQCVKASSSSVPSWAAGAGSPQDWIGEWQ